jgi:uncharacterized damage-inducible protein DinB
MIHSIAAFIDYFASIRRRTLTYLRAIPPEQVDWTPRQGEFSLGDIIRHLTAAERMFVGAVVDGRWRYDGHERAGNDDLASLIAHLEQTHLETMARLRPLSDAALQEPRPTLNGPQVKAWRLLLALTEHEIHHRSQVAVYLALLGIEPPQIYGLGVEDVIALATG